MEPTLAALARALELQLRPDVFACPEEVSVLWLGGLGLHVSTMHRGARWTWRWRLLGYPRWGEA